MKIQLESAIFQNERFSLYKFTFENFHFGRICILTNTTDRISLKISENNIFTLVLVYSAPVAQQNHSIQFHSMSKTPVVMKWNRYFHSFILNKLRVDI